MANLSSSTSSDIDSPSAGARRTANKCLHWTADACAQKKSPNEVLGPRVSEKHAKASEHCGSGMG